MAKSPNPRHYAKHMTIRSNGDEYPTLEGGTFSPGGMQRDDVTGNKVHGYTETAVASTLSVQVPANFYTDFSNINNQTDVTIEVEIDTGQIWMMRNAWNTTPVILSGGSFALEFHSADEAERIA